MSNQTIKRYTCWENKQTGRYVRVGSVGNDWVYLIHENGSVSYSDKKTFPRYYKYIEEFNDHNLSFLADYLLPIS